MLEASNSAEPQSNVAGGKKNTDRTSEVSERKKRWCINVEEWPL